MKIINTEATQLKEIYGPAVAVDAVLFSIINNQLKVLLIQIKKDPYKDNWALPGGLVQLNETLDQAAKRVLFKKTNLGNIHLEQLYSFGDLNRDIRGRIVSIAYFALINLPQTYQLKTSELYTDINWKSVDKLPSMAFDHKKIIEYALIRLKAKIEYSNIAYSLLPENFTLTKLQEVYEIISKNKLDKRNFRKKMIGLGLVEKTKETEKNLPHRPARLYRFSERELTFI